MGVATGLTAVRMLAIEAACIVSGTISGDNLILTKQGGGTVNAGNVRGPQGTAGNTLSAWPVGSIFMSAVSTNPNTLLGGGTWARFGQGKMLISQDGGDADFDTAEETGGSKTKTLIADNLPPHAHSINHGHTINTRNAPEGTNVAAVTSSSGASTVNTGNTAPNAFTGASGDGSSTLFSTPVNVMSPYIVVYMWKRTA